MKRYKDKMISTEDQREAPLSSFHFSGAGTRTGPVIVKARNREEAERIFRDMNADQKQPTPHAPQEVDETLKDNI